MLKKRLLGELLYISPFDEAIDFEKWDPEKLKDYFLKSYELPPIKEEHKPTLFKIKQLTGRQYSTLLQRIEQTSKKKWIDDPEIQKFLIQYGLSGWENLKVESPEGMKDLEFQTESTDLGEKLSDDLYYELFPFFLDLAVQMALHIYLISAL